MAERTFVRGGGGGGGNTLVLWLTLLAFAAIAIIATNFPQSVQAQSDDTVGRIVACKLDDGRVEFGWQPTGGERVLPRQRYFPTDATVNRWLRSSPVEVDGVEIGRINARLLDNGRIEFGFTPTDGERILTRARYFPTDAQAGRWLRSTEITISAPVAPGFTAVSAGQRYSCGLRKSGEIECWGISEGSIYYDEQTNPPEGSFAAVSAGDQHACAIRESGEITCWGWNTAAVTDAPEGNFTAVSAGWAHTCAVRDTGEIECWGDDTYGETNAPPGEFTAVSAGAAHACGLHESGAITCWGDNGSRWYDTETEEERYTEYGQIDAPDGSFTIVSAGAFHSCGLRESGEIECWGGTYGIAPEGVFTAVSTGNGHTCGLRNDSAIQCWGLNHAGQTDAPEGKFTAVGAGRHHTCAIRDTGAIACWGDNSDGQTNAPVR